MTSASNNKSNILVVGSLGYDYVAGAATLPTPGQTLLGDSFGTYLGGKGNNQAVGAALAGGWVSFLGRVGDDDVGGKIRDGLVAAGVAVEHLDKVAGRSGIALIMTSADGENCIIVVPGANATLSAAAIGAKAAAFATAGFVLAQLETPLDGVLAAAKLARSQGALFILDPAPACPLPAELLAQIDWLTPNETEAEALLGFNVLDDPLQGALALRALGPRNIVLKLSSRGAVLLEAGQSSAVLVPAFAVTAVDSTAAGDAFNGAFAVALSEGATAEAAVRFANAAAAISVTRRGAQPSMPKRAEIDALLAQAAHPASRRLGA